MTTPAPRPRPRPRKIQRYGWVPDLPDQRDHIYSAPRPVLVDLPPSVDLRDGCPKEVHDQGTLGSCTAHAIAAAFEFNQLRQGLPNFMPSRLFVYYNERVIAGTTDCDSGAMIRDGIKSVAKQGICQEALWPYDIARFVERPPDHCYVEAARSRAIAYQRISRSLKQLKGCLAQGYPFVFGFQVYESFEGEEVAASGMLSLPGANERPMGGHASSPSDTATRISDSRCATRGVPPGGTAAISPCRTAISRRRASPQISGPFSK